MLSPVKAAKLVAAIVAPKKPGRSESLRALADLYLPPSPKPRKKGK